MNRFAMAIAILLMMPTAATATAVNYKTLARELSGLINGNKKPRVEPKVGTINGGGASGLACTLPDGSTRVRLLDMMESTQVWNLEELPVNPATEQEAIDLLAEKLTVHFWNPWSITKAEMKSGMVTLIQEFLHGATFLKPGQDLNAVHDVHTPIADPNCKLVQIAMFYNESKFLVDTDLWLQLSWLDRAALLGHELIYLESRLNGESDSINTRKFISYLFSTHGLTPIASGAPEERAAIMSCNAWQADETGPLMASLFAYESTQPDGKVRSNFVFVSLDGRSQIFRTGFDSAISLNDFMMGGGGTMAVEYSMEIDTFPYTKNSILIKESVNASNDVLRWLSYFDKNGRLFGGPLTLYCYR